MTLIFTGVPIKVKYYLARFHDGKKSVFFLLLFAFSFLLYREIKPFFSSFTAKKTSDSIFLTQIAYQESERKEIQPTSIDISQVSIDQLIPFANNDYNSPIFEQSGTTYQVDYKNKEISHLQLSPDKKRIGFYVHYPQEGRVLDKAALAIMTIKGRNFKEINEGELKVSNWEWKSNSQAIIYINCGTGCHLAHVRSVINGKLIAEYLNKEI